MGRRLMGTLTALVALALLVPAAAFAQGTTGTIRGKVTDAASGEPLAAVNMVVIDAATGEPTSMGAFTNAEGEYVIINVPPGRYNLRATMVGYKTYEVEELLVTVGVSTMQSFSLETTVLDVGEVVTITAERDIIQRDVTATQQSYTIEEMERMAVSTTTDILALQTNTYTLDSFQDDIPGYYDRGLEQVHMRGGRNAEVAFLIDGMQITNLVFGGQAAQVSSFSLSEMVVMAGGMSAEFGNAMSGVVNMVTREGGSTYDANIEMMTSELSGQPQDDALDMTRLQAYLGGPVPVVPRLTFFLSGSARTERDYVVKKDDHVYDYKANPNDPNWVPDPNIDYYSGDPTNPYLQRDTTGRAWSRLYPTDIYKGWLGYGFDNRWDAMLNLTYKLTPSMKFTSSTSTNGRWSVPYTFGWRNSMLWGLPEWMQNYLVLGYPRYDALDPVTGEIQTDPTTGLPLLDPGNVGNHLIDGSGFTDWENEKNLMFQNNYRAAGVWTHQLNQSTFYSLRGSYYEYNRTMRVKRWVNADGYARRYEHLYNGLITDPTDPGYNQMPETPLWQPGDPMHRVTLKWILGGYDATDPFRRVYGYHAWGGAGLGNDASDRYFTNQYDVTRTLKGDITSQVTTHHQLKAGLLYNRLTLDMLDIQFPWSNSPSHTRYVKHPWEMGLYIQDKIEYDFLILNVGLRYEAAASGPNPYWVDPRNPVHPDTTLTDEQRIIVNPREYFNETGIQPPVLEGATHSSLSPRIGISHPVTDQAVIYFNYGQFSQVPIYRNVYRVNRIDRGNPITGNPNLASEKTISYEFGYKHQFTDIYALELTMWAKDTSNMVGTERVPAWFQGNANPYQYTVAINYDYAQAKGIDLSLQKRYSSYWSGRLNYSFMQARSNRDDPWQGYRDGGDGRLERQPKRTRPVGWDQPHRVSATLSIQIPEGVGPEIFGIRPIQNTSTSLIYRAAAGKPYTPTTEAKALEQFSARRPWTFQWDLRVYRDFESFGLRYSIFADVRNLFNRVNVTSVFSRTGKPDDPGPDATSYSDNYDRWHYYGTPRTINLGLRVYF